MRKGEGRGVTVRGQVSGQEGGGGGYGIQDASLIYNLLKSYICNYVNFFHLHYIELQLKIMSEKLPLVFIIEKMPRNILRYKPTQNASLRHNESKNIPFYEFVSTMSLF